MKIATLLLSRYFKALAAVALFALSGAAFATADPNSVTFTLEGCRFDLNHPPINFGNGPFICPDSYYTTGNLGKDWSELDLVPYRITAQAGNSAPTTQTYAIAIAADNCDGSTGTPYICADGSSRTPGYDVMSAPVLNTALSDASCVAAVVGAQTALAPGVGGTAVSIYRILTITQSKNTTCVYDYYERLALGSHLFPGSSLHSNLLDQDLVTAGSGAKDVSIPVNEIAPQELSKIMSAKQDTDHIWNLTKDPSPAKVSFGDVCAANAPTSLPVTITVTWTKLTATPGFITAVTNITATNPSTRTITINVSDTIYEDSDQSTPLDTMTTPAGGVDVPANTSEVVLTHTATLPAADGSIGGYLNDVATATYVDKVTGFPIPGTTTAMANAQIAQGTESDTSASITDSESISGSALTFSVAAPSVGSFTGGYVAGTPTTGPVGWDSGTESDSSMVAFSKTLYLDGKTITSGTLSDTATLTASDSFSTSASASVKISSSASVALTITKTLPPGLVDGSEKLEVKFNVTRTHDAGYSQDETLTFLAGDTTKSVTLNGLVPDTYVIKETGNVWYPSDYPVSPSQSGLLSPQGGDTVNVDLSADANGVVALCAGTAPFSNVLTEISFAHAQVQKVTDPSGDASGDPWLFTLKDPFGKQLATASVNANTGYANFLVGGVPVDLAVEGTYSVTETTETGWDLASGVPNPCTFTVDYPGSAGKTYQCSFTNVKRGKAKVVKTVSGRAPTGAQSFTFQLREGASTVSDGTTDEQVDANAVNGGTFTFNTLLIPGNHYQLCEIVMPGWNTNLGAYGTLFVPNSIIPPSLPNPNVNNMTVCVDFTVTSGQTKTFTVDNTPPPGGRAVTIGFWKNWASCASSGGKQKPTLDTTLFNYLPSGIVVGKVASVVPAYAGKYSFFGHTATSTEDCPHAVSLLNKTDFNGKKQASDPLFNMAAQLVGTELNAAAGAGICGPVVNAIGQANTLLSKYKFDGFGYSGKVSSNDATLGNCLATWLDDYNNDRASACSMSRTCP